MTVVGGTHVIFEVDIECGYQQGLVDSVWYYVPVVDEQVESTVKSWQRRQLGFWMFDDMITHVVFVDDVFLISNDFDNAMAMFREAQFRLVETSMNINVDKIQIMSYEMFDHANWQQHLEQIGDPISARRSGEIRIDMFTCMCLPHRAYQTRFIPRCSSSALLSRWLAGSLLLPVRSAFDAHGPTSTRMPRSSKTSI